MNLKESFRYQNFLEKMMASAGGSIASHEHSLKVVRRHLRNRVNPGVPDAEETVCSGEKFFANDDVLQFMLQLVEERQKLSHAIGLAKASMPFDIDSAIETNKFRQNAAQHMKRMLNHTASEEKFECGTDYKFDADGSIVKYLYDVQVETVEAFDREKAKAALRQILSEADRTSVTIDTAMTSVQVDYHPLFDVNGTFDDAMEQYLAHRKN